jgi:hypothetical protein
METTTTELQRTSETCRVELKYATESDQRLALKVSVAHEELQTARQNYDAAIEGYARGAVRDEPPRGQVEALMSKFDSLTRIAREKLRETSELRNELAKLELAEAVAAGAERMPALRDDALAALIAFEAAIGTAREAETALFTALFNQDTGLKQRFASVELRREAARHRRQITESALKAAGRHRYAINPDFSTDGEKNLGVELDMRHETAWAQRKTPDPPKVNPRDVGALVVEKPTEHEVEPISIW